MNDDPAYEVDDYFDVNRGLKRRGKIIVHACEEISILLTTTTRMLSAENEQTLLMDCRRVANSIV